MIYLASAPHDPVALALKAAAASGQVQVLDSADCYLADGEFDPDRALEGSGSPSWTQRRAATTSFAPPAAHLRR